MKTVNKLIFALSVAAILGGCSATASKHDDGHAGHAMKKTDSHSGHGDHGGGHGESAVGKPAKGMAVTKTYQVSMLDSMKFVFNQKPDLSPGDVVKFVVTNNGKISHEFSVGNAAEQAKHNAMMKQMPDMEHEDGNTVSVKPGQSKELVWQFSGHDEVVFACNVPGHYEAGMFHKAALH
ncbi:MAG: cupredoxin domain-containing protein [Thiolinea sp.]